MDDSAAEEAYLEGKRILESGDPKENHRASMCFLKAAKHGHAKAQFRLALMLSEGYPHVQIDPKSAFEWMKKSAEQAYMKAYEHLGFWYHNGIHTPQNYEQAMRCFLRLSGQDHAGAQLAIGMMYMKGTGVKMDESIGATWMLKAAQNGHAGAQAMIGNLYITGNGMPKDPKLALQFLLKSVEGNSKEMGLSLLARTEYHISSLYSQGSGVTQNHAESLKWLMKSVEHGSSTGLTELGRRHQIGHFVPQDFKKAYQLLLQAAEIDDRNGVACALIAGQYMLGQGVEFSWEKSYQWALKAVERGHVPGYATLYTVCCIKGEFQQARDWMIKAAKCPHQSTRMRAKGMMQRMNADNAKQPGMKMACLTFNLDDYPETGENHEYISDESFVEEISEREYLQELMKPTRGVKASLQTCKKCHKPERESEVKFKVCGRCKKAKYCSAECQKDDWKCHKLVCKHTK